MKKLVTQFQLLRWSLWVLAAVAVLACFCFLPFRPNVVFQQPEISFYSDGVGTLYPYVTVAVQNSGKLPIWYNGGPGNIRQFEIQGERSKREHHVQRRGRSSQTSWTRLSPGKTAVLVIPTYERFDVAVLRVEFRDWRGHAAKSSSQEFDFSSVPVNGIPGTAPTGPKPLPQ